MNRPPSKRQWELFALYQSCPPPIPPMTFLQFWDVDYRELSKLVGASRSTIEHWFTREPNKREPAERHCRRLAEIHLLWANSDRIRPSLIQHWCRIERP